MDAAEWVAAVMLVALVLYAALGGADFGGGLWDLMARGPHAQEQRQLIECAIAPVWEANHVWLILVIVLLFTAFPAAFATATIHLHIPLSLMLVGIVLRGSAFVFRKYDTRGDPVQRRWGHIFAVGSLVGPFFLGVSLGAVTAGQITASQGFAAQFLWPWLNAFSLSVGLFALGLFAFLAAVYLCVEAPTPELTADFRRRAVRAAMALPVLAVATAWAARGSSLAHVREGLWGTPWGRAALVVAALMWLLGVWALRRSRFRVARAAAVGLLVAILGGWATGQYPFLVRPQITVWNAAAPVATLRPLLAALAAGALLLFPALGWLFHVFKRRPGFAPLDEK
jgi:cytochrome d ubiquinol oxidase subunit II